ncbi:unnamed protein product, partial [Staurois parvus]
MFDPVLSDPPLLPQSPIHLLTEQILGGGKLHMISLVCIARGFFFSRRVHVISTEANQHCPDRRSRVLH